VARKNHLTEYEKLRARMVRDQIRSRGILDACVLEAMRQVPRHRFVPEHLAPQAYQDRPLSIGHGQTISQPYVVALMTSALNLSGSEKVLEIGTGSGYQAAILSVLAREVISIECVKELATAARQTLTDLGYHNVRVVLGDGSQGLPSEAPFDAIMFTAAAPEIPRPLRDQLADGGRLVGPVGSRYDQILVRLCRQEEHWERELLGPVLFVPLTGQHGWGNY
jgi:protein-L-isoaspartate(D-aspartate) O-methyltransferase